MEDQNNQPLKAIIQDILKQMQGMTAQEIHDVMNRFTSEMTQQEKNNFNSFLSEELLLATGWEKVDKSQWSQSGDIQAAIDSGGKMLQATELLPPLGSISFDSLLFDWLAHGWWRSLHLQMERLDKRQGFNFPCQLFKKLPAIALFMAGVDSEQMRPS
jgi:hypothetical protein